MALHKHTSIQRDLELLAQIIDALLFMLAAAVCKQDEGDALGLEVGKRLVGARERIGTAYEDAIDTGVC